MYIVRDLETKDILCENPLPVSDDLQGIDIYPHFDEQTMELLKTDVEDIIPSREELAQYGVDEHGFLIQKPLEERVNEGLIEFGPELTGYVEKPGLVARAVKTVELGLKVNLIKTVVDCEKAFAMLDDDFERRVAEKYKPGIETKVIKGLVEWMYEKRPENDKREGKYLRMKEDIEKIKDEYKPIRAQLKELIGALKSE